jgi:drug/metabolite transporter (DMT)-like permease
VAPDERRRRPLLGYALVAGAATLFAVNGVVAKVALAPEGLTSLRLTELRITGAAAGLLAALAVLRPTALRMSREELPFLVVFGIAGVALVQWLYFFAIHRLEIGVALLLQYTAPILVALWARFVLGRTVRRRVWAALALALAGLSLVVEVFSGLDLDALGVSASLGAAVAFAAYILLAERGVVGRDAVSLSAFGFCFGALFFAVVQPWWSFPGGALDDRVSLLGNLASVEVPVWGLALWIVVLGTIAPFGLFVAALAHVPAPRAAIVAMVEPVLATVIAWAWLEESLAPAQLAGGVLVLGGIVLAQTARGEPERTRPGA